MPIIGLGDSVCGRRPDAHAWVPADIVGGTTRSEPVAGSGILINGATTTVWMSGNRVDESETGEADN